MEIRYEALEEAGATLSLAAQVWGSRAVPSADLSSGAASLDAAHVTVCTEQAVTSLAFGELLVASSRATVAMIESFELLDAQVAGQAEMTAPPPISRIP